MIYRTILDELKAWKDSPDRKPLLLKGARQIGKTWAMERFGSDNFEFTAKFDFDETQELCGVFERTRDVGRLLKELALYTDVPLEAGRTLIVLDEIQACEAALNSLKYFCENAPEYHVVAAGSLLGVAVKKKKMQVPVGKVTILTMRPVTFSEFLRTSDERTWKYIDELDEIRHLPEIIMSKLELEYRRYLVCGGMPEAATALLENRGTAQVDKVLQDILDLYELDFAKYAEPREIPRIHAVWNSLPSQLAKENRKFLYNVVKPGARARDYEDALLWLEEAGMVQRCFNVSRPGLPLSAYRDVSAFDDVELVAGGRITADEILQRHSLAILQVDERGYDRIIFDMPHLDLLADIPQQCRSLAFEDTLPVDGHIGDALTPEDAFVAAIGIYIR